MASPLQIKPSDIDFEHLNHINRVYGRLFISLYNTASATWPESIRAAVLCRLKDHLYWQSPYQNMEELECRKVFQNALDDNGELVHEKVRFEDWFILAAIFGIDHSELQSRREILEKKYFAPMTDDFKAPNGWDGLERDESLIEHLQRMISESSLLVDRFNEALMDAGRKDIILSDVAYENQHFNDSLCELEYNIDQVRSRLRAMGWD